MFSISFLIVFVKLINAFNFSKLLVSLNNPSCVVNPIIYVIIKPFINFEYVLFFFLFLISSIISREVINLSLLISSLKLFNSLITLFSVSSGLTFFFLVKLCLIRFCVNLILFRILLFFLDNLLFLVVLGIFVDLLGFLVSENLFDLVVLYILLYIYIYILLQTIFNFLI